MSGPHFDFEREAISQGFARVAGVDEVGRGPLAGPVGVAAVILDPHDLPDGLDDLKALPEGRRDALKPVILAKAVSVAVAFASAEEIDRYNIRGATLRAMARAVRALHVWPDLALIDGRDAPVGLVCPVRPIIGGDALSLSIAAASIIAKTTRDALMRNLGPRLSGLRLRRPRGLRDGLPPQRPHAPRPVPLPPELLPAAQGRGARPKKVSKAFRPKFALGPRCRTIMTQRQSPPHNQTFT